LGGFSAEAGASIAAGIMDEMEVRALWARFGL
jgi:hypothetical protein